MSKSMNFDDYQMEEISYGYGPMFRCPCGDRAQTAVEINPDTSAMEPVINDPLYTQGYLLTKKGKRVKVIFILGTNMYVDREGILIDVGISYIVLKEINTNIDVMCDIYSIKFVEIFE